MINGFLKFFFKRLGWFVPMWYGLTMRLTRKRNIKMPKFTDYTEASRWLPRVTDYGRMWREDPLNGILDITNHPTKTYSRLVSGKPINRGFDCDDHGTMWCHTLVSNNLVDECYYCTTQYVHHNGKRGGHVITVFRKGDQWYCADYHEPTPIAQKWGWVDWHSERTNSTCVAAAMYYVPRVDSKDTIRFKGREVRTYETTED